MEKISMNKKLVEEFVDKHYSEDFKVVKSYIGGNLSSIEIMPAGDGQSIYIWEKKMTVDRAGEIRFVI